MAHRPRPQLNPEWSLWVSTGVGRTLPHSRPRRSSRTLYVWGRTLPTPRRASDPDKPPEGTPRPPPTCFLPLGPWWSSSPGLPIPARQSCPGLPLRTHSQSGPLSTFLHSQHVDHRDGSHPRTPRDSLHRPLVDWSRLAGGRRESGSPPMPEDPRPRQGQGLPRRGGGPSSSDRGLHPTHPR